MQNRRSISPPAACPLPENAEVGLAFEVKAGSPPITAVMIELK